MSSAQPAETTHKRSPPILEARDLVVSFRTDRGTLRAVDGVSFDVPARGSVGIVGESGSGKSVTSLSIMRLIQTPPGKIESGSLAFEGRDLLKLSEREMRAIRGNKISMIFQEPMTSLNPVYSVGAQIVEAIRLHQKRSRSEARERSIEMLRLVGIPDPERRVDSYAHELSGGMRQRVMIAMALACEPRLLIADEPTTALDVTIQAQVLDLLKKLRKMLGMSVMLITHDLAVVAEFADRVVVMYAGRVVEQGPVDQVFKHPRQPVHTRLASIASAVRQLGRSVQASVSLADDRGARARPAELAAGLSLPGSMPRKSWIFAANRA